MTSDRGSCRRDVNPFAGESRSCGCPDLPGASSTAGQVVAVPLNCSGGSGRRTYAKFHSPVPPPPVMYVPCPPLPLVKCRRRTSPLYGFPTPPEVSRFARTRFHPPRHNNNIILYYARSF